MYKCKFLLAANTKHMMFELIVFTNLSILIRLDLPNFD